MVGKEKPQKVDQQAGKKDQKSSKASSVPKKTKIDEQPAAVAAETKLPPDIVMQGDGIIPLHLGTNKFASQKGMTGFGVPRNITEKVVATNLKPLAEEKLYALNEVVPLQSGTNKFDSQRGMTAIGTIRDISYNPKGTGGTEELSEEKARMSETVLPMLTETHKLASQSGTKGFGGTRWTYSKEYPEQDPESMGVLNAQMGSNRFASQSGMTDFGMGRAQVGKYVDNARGELPYDEGTLSRQRMGCSGANQTGMKAFGTFRSNTMLLSRCDRKSQGLVPLQMGVNWADSQAGKTGFGQPRNVITEMVDEKREPLPEEVSRDPNVPKWSSGYQYGASQSGMTGMGMPRDVKGFYLRRLW